MKSLCLRMFSAFIFFVFVQSACAQLPAYLPTNGLVAWYPFNGNANDESGNGNDASVIEAQLSIDRQGNSNSCYYFNGTSNHISLNDHLLNFGTSNFTISAWQKKAISSSVYCIIGKRSAPSLGNFIELNSSPGFEISENTNEAQYLNDNFQLVSSDSNWQHVVIARINNTVSIYTNGQLSHVFQSSYIHNINNSAIAEIGARYNGSALTQYFHGSLDDISIYNRGLTANEVTNLFILGNTSFQSNTSPPGIPYQAEVRNESGDVLANANVNIRFTLHELTANGAVSFQETHALTTNELGLFAATIGAGTATQGTFASINWAQTTKFLKVEVDAGNGYITMGNQQLMSVPYALYAANGPVGPQGPQGEQGLIGSTGPQGEAGNSIISTQINNDSLFVTYGNNQIQNAGKVKNTYTAGNGIRISGDTISSSRSVQNILLGGVPTSRVGFNSSSTWTCPPGVTQILVDVWGAGGGGGSGVTRCVYSQGCGSGNGGNGGSGGYNRSIISVIPGQNYSILIGAGGLGGGDNCPPYVGYSGGCNYGPYCGVSDGADGGSTSFNGLVTASGGSGGKKACIEKLCSGWISTVSNGTPGQILNYPSYSFPSFINPVYMSSYSLPGCCTSGGQGGTGGCPNNGYNGESGYCIISY